MARRRRKERKKKKSAKAKSVRPGGKRDIVVLFADVVGCAEISNNKEIEKYNAFINSFRECFKTVCEYYKREEYEENEYDFFQSDVRGDEGCLKIFMPNRDDLSRDIDIAIKIGLDLKRKWLLEEENRGRIKNGLLPVDIGIGIHAGKAYLNKEGNTYRPEGYAINLTKRIESESRGGKFSHILVSDSACGQLHRLKDEWTYRFDTPYTISPRGISRDIKVFEIKHHFLPTDWTDMPLEVSMMYREIDDDKLKVAEQAYDINPMNLWLAEEYILLSIMNDYKNGKGYWQALEVARYIVSKQRDAGALALLGFILGEQRNFKEEQDRYKEAIDDLDEQDELLHWYLGYSISCELDDKRRKEKAKIKEFYAREKERIKDALKEFARAFELRPWNVWNVYDYACELSWWSKAEESFRKTAIDKLIYAFGLNEDTMVQARGEPYLKPIIDDPKVKKHLKS